ncbi:DUF4184 family protein [Gilliamella sp. ESL0232]|nr:DUF4184 family protein [Gilliamella sp.]MCO6550026.1 DUF4184 family protein [Gilliamella sp.]MCO6556458.1 DUF4184 family protein [Gilliamella sp.]NUE96648.1 DUF4184 family protein [Gilliamella sp. ESL0232]
MIGIISHIRWDSFTHPSGCFVQLFSLLQHGSSLIGMSFVGLFIIYRL